MEVMMKKGKKLMMIILIIIVAIVLIGIGGKTYIEANLNKVVNASIPEMDLTRIADGIYSGNFNAFPVMVEVKVTVSNHEITEIEIVKHVNGQGAPAEIITDKVIEAQSLQVDTVSGATYSSKVILKAIENALSSEVE
jgi:uncharacterized protein with FMN-binding domain